MTEFRESTVVPSISSSFNLGGNTTLDRSITHLTINGNGTTINGQNKYRFLAIPSGCSVTINNITIKNCTSDHGGAIHNNGTLNITNSNLNYNNVIGTRDFHGGGASATSNSLLLI